MQYKIMLVFLIMFASIVINRIQQNYCKHDNKALYGNKARTKKTPFVCLNCGKIIERDLKM